MDALTHVGSFTFCNTRPPFRPTSTPSSSSSKKLCSQFRATATTTGAGGNDPVSTATFSASKWADRLLSDFQFFPPVLETSSSSSSSATTVTSIPPSLAPPDRHVPIPLNFYQVLGAEAHFLGDGIRRAFEGRVSKPPQYGYSHESLVSRRQILQAACDTLSNPSSRREYNLGLAEDEEDTVLTDVPFDKVPGALCVLQEAGESELVLVIGENLLRETLPKPFKHDVLLTMALAYVEISRDMMALSVPDYVRSCEALERALKLLMEEGSSSLAPDLQAQIDETLEEITPQCVLELLALPLTDEFHQKRGEALQGVRNILWSVGGGGATAVAGGFTREDFMNEAFAHMTAAEQVDLFAATPNNIPAESFEVYGVALALVSQAFIGRKPRVIQDADNLFQQLQQTKLANLSESASLYASKDNREKDFALERGLCSLLVGDLDKCRSWLGLDSESSPYRDPSIVDFILENSQDDQEEGDGVLFGLCKLLETWLMEVVFPRFRETQGVQFTLGDYYDNPLVLRYLERLDGASGSPLAAAAAIVRIGAEATAVLDNVKESAIQALRKVFPSSKSDDGKVMREDSCISYGSSGNEDDEMFFQSYQNDIPGTEDLLRKSDPGKVYEQNLISDKAKDVALKIACAGVVIGLTTLAGMRFWAGRSNSGGSNKPASTAMASVTAEVDIVSDKIFEETMKMDARLAEAIVRKWQDIKSQALGPDHCLEKLSEVLDGKMLKIWINRAREIADQGWYWEYTLKSVTMDSLTLSVDGRHAMVETTLEEEARLIDSDHPEKNDSYSKTYTTRYEFAFTLSGWKIIEGAVLK